MPIVIGKSVNFLLTKFTPKADQIYSQLRTPGLNNMHVEGNLSSFSRTAIYDNND